MNRELIREALKEANAELLRISWAHTGTVREGETEPKVSVLKKCAEALAAFEQEDQQVAWVSDCCSASMWTEMDRDIGVVGNVCDKCNQWCQPVPKAQVKEARTEEGRYTMEMDQHPKSPNTILYRWSGPTGKGPWQNWPIEATVAALNSAFAAGRQSSK